MASSRVAAVPPSTGSLGVPVQPGPVRTHPRQLAALSLARRAPTEITVPAGVPVLWHWNAVTGRVSCSARVREALRLPEGTEVGLSTIRRMVHPDDRERFDDLVLELARGRGAVQDTLRFVTPAGAVRSLHAWAAVRTDGTADTLAGAFGGLVDVTGFGPEVDALHGSLAALHATEELTGAGLWEWDPGTGELLWSAPMYGLIGVAPGAVTPTLRRWHDAVHPQDRERAARLIDGALERDAGGRTETLRVVGADGVLRHVRCWAGALPEPAGRRVHGAAVEVSRQVRDQVRLERLSATDSVTGLMNRHGVGQRLRGLVAEGAGDVALILLDLDRFQVVNDTLGHHVGDDLLVQVSRRLDRIVPEGTVTARMGGDEFAVVPLPGTTIEQVRRLAESIVASLRLPYKVPGAAELLTCSVSAGVTSRAGRPIGSEELLAEADLALYQAKNCGRGRYVVFDDALRARARARHLAERALRSALDEGRLVLRYQPVVDLRTGRRVGAEALVRIGQGDDASEQGLLLPDAFIDVAEDTGLVVELDRWVIDNSLDQLARWVAETGSEQAPWLAVNVSALSMQHPGIVRGLLDGLAERRLPSGLFKVELTERSFLGADPAAEASLRELIGSGVPVGIDDFGTGYSALAYLQRFDLDFMKIDRSFVAAVGSQGRADAVVTAIVDLAHAHGMQVTAEGIEHPAQANRLREIGCDQAQGFHFGRPETAPTLIAG